MQKPSEYTFADSEFVPILLLHPADIEEETGIKEPFTAEELKSIAKKMGETLMEGYWFAVRDAVRQTLIEREESKA